MNSEALRSHSTNAAALWLLDLLCHYAGNEDTVDWEGFNEVEAQLRALLSAQGDGWRPIETAPKDGRTLLLGCFNKNGKWRTMRGQWMSEDYIAEYWEDPEGVNAGWYEDAVEAEDIPNCWPIDPTHWMPLPAPPGELAKQTEAK